MHRLLRRQLRKHLGEDWRATGPLVDLLSAVGLAYEQADEDRNLLERSIEVSSNELRKRNEDLRSRLKELERTQVQLADSNSLLRSTLDSTVDAIAVISNDGIIRAHNRQFAVVMPVPGQHHVGEPATPLLRQVLRESFNPEALITRIRSVRHSPNARFKEILEMRDGRCFELTSIPQIQEGRIEGRVFSFHDITKRRLDEETIRHQAYHDALTGLPNRLLMTDRLRHAISLAERSGSKVVLFFLDLDHFKSVNDHLGHAVGDELLKEVATRLNARLRASDTICRLGGDEFTAILEGAVDNDGWKVVANDLIRDISQPYLICGHELWISVSIGVSCFPRDAQNAEDLVRHADMAMYEAKQLGRNRYAEFSSMLKFETDRKAALEAELRHAIENDELQLAFQPKYDLESLEPVGFEALLRWTNHNLGTVRPDEFIPVAEQSGLIVPIGRWVINAACQQLQRWQAMGHTNITLAVNLSTQQFKHPALLDDIERALKVHKVGARWLEFEITESSVMDDVEHVTSIMLRLRHLGIALSIDDFGSGYSSMSYLKNLPVDFLKIDRDFVREIHASRDDVAIVASMITLGHNLGLKVVAEGVETDAGLEIIRNLQCDLAQGYKLNRPLTADAATVLLEERGRAEG